jgi:hypothetical protein
LSGAIGTVDLNDELVGSQDGKIISSLPGDWQLDKVRRLRLLSLRFVTIG